MSEIKSKMRLVQMSNYVQPKVEESYSKEYVTYGEKNQYFQYLIDRSRGSATNGAVVKSIIDMIHGQGLNNEDFYNTIPEEDIRRLANDIKRMGQCAIQVQYFGGRKSVKGSHIPVETLAAEKVDEDGNINAYYYARDWEKVRSMSDVERLPSFNSKEKGGIEILYIKPYNSGLFYYSTVDYQGGLQYAELEEEVSNYHINNIQNGLAPSMLINMNNGIPESEEKAKQIEKRITEKYTGSSNAGRFVLMFNDTKEAESTITPIPLSDASEQYQFLSDESSRKIMLSHRVTSPTLFGLSSGNGFSSNTDELKVASILFETMVIKPFRQLLIEAFDELNEFNGDDMELEFMSLNPFADLEDKDAEVEQTEEVEETPDEEISLSKDEFDFDDEAVLNNLRWDVLDGEEWELVDSREYDEANNDEQWATDLIEEDKSTLKKFADTITAKASGFSYLDKSFYKIRYKYSERYSSATTRRFCKTMMNRNQIYRLEDIDYASTKGINKSFGHKGQSYDLFKYKGGVNCGHYWTQMLYRRKKKTNGKYREPTQDINEHKNVKEIPKTYKGKPRGTKESVVAPKDMPNNGHHPNYTS